MRPGYRLRASIVQAVRNCKKGGKPKSKTRMVFLEKMEGELALLISICRGQGDTCPILEHLEQ